MRAGTGISGPVDLTSPWLELEDAHEPGAGDPDRRRSRRLRATILAALAGLALVVALPGVVRSAEPPSTMLPDGGQVEQVLTDEVGHRLDRGNVREVEVAADGTVWLAVGRRVLALDLPGATEPRAPGWRSFPRRLQAPPDGALWAVEDGGATVELGVAGWVPRVAVLPAAEDPLSLDAAALEQLRAAGIEGVPRVVAAGSGPDGRRWLMVDTSSHQGQPPAEYRLLRYDGSAWAVLGPDEGLPRDTRLAWTTPGPQAPAALAVDGGGRAWFSLDANGLWLADDSGIERVRFPGLGTGALDLAGTADGDVWIATTRGGLFRWSPEARAAL